MIPRPYTERIERIELALEVAGGDTANVANEVAIDVIGMGLVLSERAVEVDLINPHRPALANEDFSLIYEVIAPVVIPLIRTILRPPDERRGPKVRKCGLMVPRREKATLVKRRNGH